MINLKKQKNLQFGTMFEKYTQIDLEFCNNHSTSKMKHHIYTSKYTKKKHPCSVTLYRIYNLHII